ncbi:MAG: chemotaxis response regulator protein-glutamate methylesterase [Actinomycetota bacterium]|nr:chemotaxis response regulator protein-glutamate methylesterase [Actinomycetota bacterium]
MTGAIRVLIVDDSAVARRVLTQIISSDPGLQVIATAPDPFIAAEKIRWELPDVILLDVEMPRMDGITFLRKIMTQHPMPVVICSSLSDRGAQTAMNALGYGAVEVIQKPGGREELLQEAQVRICDAIRAAAIAGPGIAGPELPGEIAKTENSSASRPGRNFFPGLTGNIVVAGASTGGTEAIRVFLEAIPPDGPAIVIVQHMPERFTEAFANRLDRLCRISVREARDGDALVRGQALIAPGNRHVLLKKGGAGYYVAVRHGPLVCRHRPSVDVLFNSAAQYAGKKVIGVIMTGMGNDGAKGMLAMKEAGAYTIAQDEATSVVFGMPGEAIKLGGAQKVLPLGLIAPHVLTMAG